MDKRCLSVDETAAALGLGRTKLYELINEGQLKSVTVGRRRLVPAAAVDQFLAARMATEEPDKPL